MFQFQPFMALVLRSGGAHQRMKQDRHLEAAFTASFKSSRINKRLIPLRNN